MKNSAQLIINGVYSPFTRLTERNLGMQFVVSNTSQNLFTSMIRRQMNLKQSKKWITLFSLSSIRTAPHARLCPPFFKTSKNKTFHNLDAKSQHESKCFAKLFDSIGNISGNSVHASIFPTGWNALVQFPDVRKEYTEKKPKKSSTNANWFFGNGGAHTRH